MHLKINPILGGEKQEEQKEEITEVRKSAAVENRNFGTQ